MEDRIYEDWIALAARTVGGNHYIGEKREGGGKEMGHTPSFNYPIPLSFNKGAKQRKTEGSSTS